MNPDPDRLRDAEEEVVRLRSLVDSFAQLNSSLDFDTVLANTLRRATELTNAAIGSIALVDEERKHLQFVESTDLDKEKLKELRVPIDQGIVGHVVKSGEPVRVEDCYSDTRFYKKVDTSLGSRTKTYLCVPLIADGEVIGTTQIMNRKDGGSFSARDEVLLVGFSQLAALAIKNVQRHELMLKQKETDSELRLCASIQQNLFPKSVPAIPGYELYGSSVPSKKVGGDYYTFVPQSDGSYDVVQADVSGKGMSAALTVSEIHCAVHLLAEAGRSLSSSVEALNRHLGRSLVLGRFVTLFAIRIRPDDPVVEVVVAGHSSPRIVSADGSIRSIARTRPILGPGRFQNMPADSRRETLEPGDILFAFTDGYSEADDPAGRFFGEDPLGELVREHRELDLATIRERLDAAVDAFQAGEPQSDDRSLLLVRRL